MTEQNKDNEITWTFLTNHAHVLLCLASSPSMRMRDIAKIVGITERAVQHIIGDLDRDGYIDRLKEGRRNIYQIHMEKELRHSLESHRTIAGLIAFIHEASETDT
jgi:predicted transcriptional regulator